jgi:hypothetical protein
MIISVMDVTELAPPPPPKENPPTFVPKPTAVLSALMATAAGVA